MSKTDKKYFCHNLKLLFPWVNISRGLDSISFDFWNYKMMLNLILFEEADKKLALLHEFFYAFH